jgi:uncharacterized iron-regulated membrane protein
LRWLFLAHRYLGIAVSLLMVVWCLSGAVMLYVSYPTLTEAQRLAALPALDLSRCCLFPGAPAAIDAESRIASVRVEMLADHAVAEVKTAVGIRTLIELDSGAPLGSLSLAQAATVARSFAQRRGLPQTYSGMSRTDYDQWTISEQLTSERPLYKFSWHDAQATQLYVSAVSGKAVQLTTATLRFWNWLGAIPHWIYFSPLRHRVAVWTPFIVYTSLLGCFLTVTGIYLGIFQFMRRPSQWVSPYHGYMFWHHVPGLLFGIFALSWALSGLFSMTPWGFLAGTGSAVEDTRLSGKLPRWAEVQAALGNAAAQFQGAQVVSLRGANFDGHFYLISARRNGVRNRLDSQGRPSPLSTSEVARAAAVLCGTNAPPPELLTAGDAYYYPHHSAPVVFPVYRLELPGVDQIRYYLDSVSGQIVSKVDHSDRAYRWWHQGLHRLDFTATIRTRPAWDVLMLFLLLGVTTVSATGLYSAVLRVSGKRGTPRAKSFVAER